MDNYRGLMQDMSPQDREVSKRVFHSFAGCRPPDAFTHSLRWNDMGVCYGVYCGLDGIASTVGWTTVHIQRVFETQLTEQANSGVSVANNYRQKLLKHHQPYLLPSPWKQRW